MVRDRSGNRCEYCRISQNDISALRFHVEHIIARQHGGTDDSENLAYSCFFCNLHKGTNLTGIDPDSGAIVRLFNPRTEPWEEHLELVEGIVRGTTPTGRVTVRLLNMNAPNRIELRLGTP